MQPFDEALALITCSYGPDFLRCQRLCRSVDRWVDSAFEHTLIVPNRDMARFRALENKCRRVLAVEDVVPAALWQVPLSQRWWLDAGAWPVRGWILQQITKLSANYACSAEYLMFIDSDVCFVAPFDPAVIVYNKKLRLHRIAGAKNRGQHLRWHHRAAELLGVERQYFGADYIGQLITWRRSQLEALQDHLEQIHQQPWHRGIAHSLQVSEYILYGAFVDTVIGRADNGHFETAVDLCHCCWFPEDASALANGTQQLRKSSIAVLLQSNLGLRDDEEQQILRRLELRSQ